MIAVIFGSSTMNTEFAAQRVVRAFGSDTADLHDVKTISSSLIERRRSMVFITSTWGAGDLQDDWEAFFPQLQQMDLTGKIFALVGLGDQENYPDSFCDSIALLNQCILQQGGIVVGETSTEGYNFKHSRAARDHTFVGLVLDEDNQADLTDTRIRDWVSTVRPLLS